eukprot:1517880-Amphidinium_carterae.1
MALKRFRSYAAASGLPMALTSDLSMYVLRHGGASDDWMCGRKDRESLKRHGRWRSNTSVQRYEKATKAMKESANLPPETKSYGALIERLMPQIVMRSWA